VLIALGLLLLFWQARPPSSGAKISRVVGVVVDSQNAPITGASLAHTGLENFARTDDQGRFAVETQGPFLVVRKEGFQSTRVKLTFEEPVRVVLERAGKPFPACTRRSLCDSLPGESFCFPRVQGVSASNLQRDIDYVVRVFSVNSGTGRQAVQHGAGQFWSRGPDDKDVWDAQEYRENVFPFLDFEVRDARGRTSDGKNWRSLYIFQGVSEEASYRDADADSARLLDRVLDGVCLRESEISKSARDAQGRSQNR
jgi:Carboxypeptidase regulatory-like domain